MKATKEIVLTLLNDGGVSIRADWKKEGKNQVIAGTDYTPELLFKSIQNLRKIKFDKEQDYYEKRASEFTSKDLKNTKLMRIADMPIGYFSNRITELVNKKELTEDEAGAIKINFDCWVCKKNVTRYLDDVNLQLSHACSTKCFKVHG